MAEKNEETTLLIKKEQLERFIACKVKYQAKVGEQLSHAGFLTVLLDKWGGWEK